MSRFIYKDNKWWAVDYDRINDNSVIYISDIYGNSQTITVDDFVKCDKTEAKYWRNLPNTKPPYLLNENEYKSDIWVSPDGKCFGDINGSHYSMATYILKWYGEECEFSDAVDILENKGWIRLSLSFWSWHLSGLNYCWKVTQIQSNIIFDWCSKYGKRYPIDIIEIK